MTSRRPCLLRLGLDLSTRRCRLQQSSPYHAHSVTAPKRRRLLCCRTRSRPGSSRSGLPAVHPAHDPDRPGDPTRFHATPTSGQLLFVRSPPGPPLRPPPGQLLRRQALAGVDAAISSMLLATVRKLMRVATAEEVVGLLMDAVRDMGGSVTPIRSASALDIDLSFGMGGPLLPRRTDPSCWRCCTTCCRHWWRTRSCRSSGSRARRWGIRAA